MEITVLLELSQRQQLRDWLQKNHTYAKECWVILSRSKNPPVGVLSYQDVVEEALCFGWIDSTLKKSRTGDSRNDYPQEGRTAIGPNSTRRDVRN